MADENPVGAVQSAGADTQVTAEALDPAKAAGTAGEQVGAEGSQPEGETEQDREHKKRLGGWQRAKIKAEQERDYWRDVALRSQTQPPKEQAAEPEQPKGKPQPHDFVIAGTDTYDVGKYAEAIADWKFQERDRARQADEAKAKQADEQRSAADQWRAKLDAGRDKHDDFDEIAFAPDVPYSEAMVQAVATADNGHDVAYYLGTKDGKQDATRISKLPPVNAALEIGRISARLAHESSAAAAAEKQDAPPAQSPPAAERFRPPQTVSKTIGAGKIDLNDPKVPIEVWMRERKKQRAQK